MSFNFHQILHRIALCVYQDDGSYNIEVFSDGLKYVTHVKQKETDGIIFRYESGIRRKSIQLAINSYKKHNKIN